MNAAPIAVSIGEPAGIGPDIILLAWQNRNADPLPPFFVVGDAKCLRNRAKLIGIEVQFGEYDTTTAAGNNADYLQVVEIGNFKATPGKPNSDDAPAVLAAIRTATDMALNGSASAIVTCPINKGLLYEAGFDHPGHTEFLAHLCSQTKGKKYQPVMMLSGPQLKTVPVSIHIPICDVPGQLTTELIVDTCRIVASDLTSRFGLASPRIAIAGLNPHAGENGSIGMEDRTVIEPAIVALKNEGLNIAGPLPADTMFHAEARSQYDVAICMYHDQALIPAKTLNFHEAVNVTLGLPIIRTSPDHGTAFDIAGSGNANPTSFVAALNLAYQMAN